MTTAELYARVLTLSHLVHRADEGMLQVPQVEYQNLKCETDVLMRILAHSLAVMGDFTFEETYRTIKKTCN
jgi:hypothetical protein